MARYRKIDPRFWADEGIQQLPPDNKLIALYAITGQSNRIGLFRFSPGMACEDLGLPLETFAEGFSRVCETLRWRFDEERRVLYLPTWWKYNRPENPNVLKACLGDLHELPQTPLCEEFASNLTYLPETFHQTFLEGCGKPSPKPSPNQEQEQEQEPKQEQDTSPKVTSNPKKASETEPPAKPDGGIGLAQKLGIDSARHDFKRALAEILKPGTDNPAYTGIRNFAEWVFAFPDDRIRDVIARAVDLAKDSANARYPYRAFITKVQDQMGYIPPSKREGSEAA